MSIEDRVRAATRARTDLVRDIRPLDLPEDLLEETTRPARRRPGRRWINWGAPLAAAALVTVLALVLVMLRQAGGPQPAPAVPASGASASGSSAAGASAPASAPASIPRYYVALAYTGSTSSQLKAVVGDDRTGAAIAVLNPSGSQNFYGVTGAADDRTFVVLNYTATTKQTSWYLLRVTPGAAHPTQLSKLPIKPLVAQVAGLALSPDGRELAVMWRTATTNTNAVTYLAVYSMASGAVLHTWITKGDNLNAIAGGANGEGLTWVNGDRSVDFRWRTEMDGPDLSFTDTVRSIDVSAPGNDLLADSRIAVQLPPDVTPTKTQVSVPCATELTTSNGTLVCGSTSATDVSFEEVCSTLPPTFATYSGTTGKRLKVLYEWHGQCLEAQAMPAWTDSTGSQVIAFLGLSEKGIKTSLTDEFGLVADGKFTAMPKLAVGEGPDLNQGGLAF
jgi:hypothetical protein